MTARVLAVSSSSDLPETHMFCGLRQAGVEFEVMYSDAVGYRHTGSGGRPLEYQPF